MGVLLHRVSERLDASLMFEFSSFFLLYLFTLTARLPKVVERPLSVREAAGSIPGRVIPKTLVMASLLDAQDLGLALQLVCRCQDKATGRGSAPTCIGAIHWAR